MSEDETAAPFGGGLFVADTSAWKWIEDERVRDEWAAAMRDEQILMTPIVMLELLYTATDEKDFAAKEEALSAMLQADLGRTTWHRALGAMRELAQAGPLHHRVPATDALIAAAAAERGAGVLHFDKHFRRLGEVLGIPTRPIVPLNE